MSDANSALEQKWAQEEANKAPLQKAYEKVGNKKTDEEKLNPEKLSSDLLNQLPEPTGWRILILPYRGHSLIKTKTNFQQVLGVKPGIGFCSDDMPALALK